MDEKRSYIEGIYKDCKIKKGSGNLDADIVMIYEGPKFKSSKKLQQISKEAKIPGKLFYATPLKKGFPKGYSKTDVLSDIKAEIITVSPKVVWLVGSFALEMFDVGVPMSKGYGMYFPLFLDDFFSFIMPSSDMINKMPRVVEREFHKRMKLHSKELKSKKLTVDSDRRIDHVFMKKFNEKSGFKYDKMLSGPKTYYMMFSNTAESHIFILPTKEAKGFFKDNVPFGLKFTQEEVKKISPKLLEHVAIMMKEGRAELIDIDLDVLRRKIDV